MLGRYTFAPLIACFAAITLSVMAQPPEPDTEQQRARFEAYRKRPDHLARLRENYQAFKSLKESRRVEVVNLDAELHKFSEKKQARYWGVLERYADWLDQLKTRDRNAYQAIKDAPDAATRLALIKKERDAEWIRTQPKAHREEWSKLPEDERRQYVADLRKAERQKHQQWQIAARFWKELENKQYLPCRLSDFSNRIRFKDLKSKDKEVKFKEKEVSKVQEYVVNYLLPYISDAEKKQLEEAEGHWPDYPQTLVEIARKRPSALPPPNEADLPKLLSQLPVPIQERLKDTKGVGKAKLSKEKELRTYEKSPGFAGQVVQIGTSKGSIPFEHEFWPSHFKGLSKPMQEFVALQLIPKLDTKDKKDLEDHEGRWPFYPKKIQELAKKHHLLPPWHILPEPEIWHWDRYRRDIPRAPAPEKTKDDIET